MTSYEMRSSDWSSAVCASDRLLSFFACGRRGAWVAWAVDDPKRGPFELHTPVDAKRYPHLTAARVPLSKQDVDVFYRHFSKEAFWPMLHTFWERARFREDHWQIFCRVNLAFAQRTAAEAADGATVWQIGRAHV